MVISDCMPIFVVFFYIFVLLAMSNHAFVEVCPILTPILNCMGISLLLIRTICNLRRTYPNYTLTLIFNCTFMVVGIGICLIFEVLFVRSLTKISQKCMMD